MATRLYFLISGSEEFFLSGIGKIGFSIMWICGLNFIPKLSYLICAVTLASIVN